MSHKKGARLISDMNTDEATTTSLFIRNHKSPEHLLEQVMTTYIRGHLEETLYLINCIIDNNSPLLESADFFIIHARALIELHGFNTDARSAIKQALLIEPDHEVAISLKELAQIRKDLKDGLYDKSEHKLLAHLENRPEDPYASYILAYHLFWKNGSASKAQVLLETCVRLRPSFLKAWHCLGMAYKKTKNYDGVEKAFNQCLALDENENNQSHYKKHLQSL